MGSSDAAVLAFRSTAKHTGRPDIFDRMKAEHDRLRFLAGALRLTEDGAPMQSMRRLLIDRLSDALEAHSSAAEQCFYAELLARSGDERPARRAVEAHNEAAMLVDELSEMETTDAAWQTAVDRLTGLLKAQFTQEAEETFPLAKTLLDSARAVRLGDRYDDARRGWIEAFGRQPVASMPAPTLPAPSIPAASGPQPVERPRLAEPSPSKSGKQAGRSTGAHVRRQASA